MLYLLEGFCFVLFFFIYVSLVSDVFKIGKDLIIAQYMVGMRRNPRTQLGIEAEAKDTSEVNVLLLEKVFLRYH